MEEKRKKFGIELLPSLRKRLKQRALDQEKPMWMITQEAIEQYLNGVEEEPEEDPGLTQCRFIFDHLDDAEIEAFKTTVSAYFGLAGKNPKPRTKRRRVG